jgi:hypothetical protein
MQGTAAAANRVAREIGFDPDIDAASACALMGVRLEDILAEIERRRIERAARMRVQMALAAKAGGVRRILRGKEDDAYVDMMIHPTSYFYWARRLGRACWDDPTFCREYKRDNPEARVRLASERLVLGVSGNKPAPAGLVAGRPTSRADRLTIRLPAGRQAAA